MLHEFVCKILAVPTCCLNLPSAIMMADTSNISTGLSNQENVIKLLEDKVSIDEKGAKNVQDKCSTGTVIIEGKAQVHFPGAQDAVFYNPVQEFNRDLR